MVNGPRRICAVTGTRAEYGLLYWLLHEIRQDPELHLQLVACAAHLCAEHGMTVEQIEADGFTIDARVEMLLAGDGNAAMAKSTGLGVIGFTDAFTRLRPDMVVILGDRFEMLAAAQTALLLGIPIAHIHGGEITTGAVDDSIRHAITKMATLHFTATEAFRRRVIQMGEPPHRVFNVGAPGLEHLHRTTLLNRKQLSDALGFDAGSPLFLVTIHPVTRGPEDSRTMVNELCRALEAFPEARVIWTFPNADAGGQTLRRIIERWAADRSHRVLLTPSLGQQRYLSALKLADVVIGNSSSGIIEAPAAGTPTVNIGSRQEGRPLAPSIISCKAERKSIAAAIVRASTDGFRRQARQADPPYGRGNSAAAILQRLKHEGLTDLSPKVFHDVSIPVEQPEQGHEQPTEQDSLSQAGGSY